MITGHVSTLALAEIMTSSVPHPSTTARTMVNFRDRSLRIISTVLERLNENRKKKLPLVIHCGGSIYTFTLQIFSKILKSSIFSSNVTDSITLISHVTDICTLISNATDISRDKRPILTQNGMSYVNKEQ